MSSDSPARARLIEVPESHMSICLSHLHFTFNLYFCILKINHHREVGNGGNEGKVTIGKNNWLCSKNNYYTFDFDNGHHRDPRSPCMWDNTSYHEAAATSAEQTNQTKPSVEPSSTRYSPPPSNSATELSVKVFPVVSLEAVRDCGRCLLCGLQEAITAPCIH